jgi:hypothetical protein
MKLGTWIASLVQPLLARVLVSLGFSVVSITGMTVVMNQLKDQLLNQANQLPAAFLQLFLMAGGGVGLGMIFGAITTKIMLWQIQKSTQILGSNNG